MAGKMVFQRENLRSPGLMNCFLLKKWRFFIGETRKSESLDFFVLAETVLVVIWL